MAKADRKPRDALNVRTPRGALRFPKLLEPDHGTEKFPKKNPEYNTGLILKRGAPGVDAFLAKLDELMEESKALAEEAFAALPLKTRKQIEAKTGGISADSPYEVVYDNETEEETGEVVIKAKTVASGVSKKTGKPWSKLLDLFDARGKPIPRSVRSKLRIWGGTVAVLNMDLKPYFVDGSGSYGIGRYLNAVQIIELVDGGSKSASSYGFGEEDEGFDASGFSVDDADDDDDSGFSGGVADEDDAGDTNF